MVIKLFKYIVSIFLLLFCLEGCKQKIEDAENKIIRQIPLDLDHEIYTNSFDSIFRKSNVIKLETTDRSIIGSVSKIESYNKRIYVIDCHSNYSVSCFNENGTFLFELKKIGKGPSEYISINDGGINMSTGDIELLAQNQLMVYDSLGNFKEKVKLPCYASSFCTLKGIRYFYKDFSISKRYQRKGYRLFSLDSGGNFKKYLKYRANGKGTITQSITNFTRVNPNEFRFIESYNDTVYRITSDTIQPLYAINFKGFDKNKKPKNLLDNQRKYPNIIGIAEKLKLPRLIAFYEFDNYIAGYYNKYIGKLRGVFLFIYDKNREELIQNMNNIYSDYLGLSTMILRPTFLIDKKPATLLYPYQIKSLIDMQKSQGQKERIKSFFEYNDSTIYENPYIIQYE